MGSRMQQGGALKKKKGATAQKKHRDESRAKRPWWAATATFGEDAHWPLTRGEKGNWRQATNGVESNG